MKQKNLFRKGAKLVSLHFWDETRSIHVITNHTKKAVESMKKIYPEIQVAIATGQPNKPQENQLQFRF